MLYLNKTFSIQRRNLDENATPSNLMRLFRTLDEDVVRHMDERPPIAATPEIIKRFNNFSYNITGVASCQVNLENVRLLYETKTAKADARSIVSLGNHAGAIEIYNNTLEPFVFDFHSLYHIKKHLKPQKQPTLLRDYACVETRPETLNWKEVRYV